VATGILISLLSYKEIAPPPELAPYVRCLWRLHGRSDASTERILPDATFEMITHEATPMLSGGESQPRAMLMGEIRRPVIVQSAGVIDVTGVRFRLGGASAFFDEPMIELRDRITDMRDVRLRRTPTPRPAWSMVREAIRQIRRAHMAVRIRDVAVAVGVTERTLERAFRDIVGIGPKRLARIIRFQRALRSDDALAYYDQSHRIHEFRELAGVTPTEFWREQHPMNDAFVGNLQS
jgi:AraC-like DNA-binding protein